MTQKSIDYLRVVCLRDTNRGISITEDAAISSKMSIITVWRESKTYATKLRHIISISLQNTRTNRFSKSCSHWHTPW